MNGMGETQFGPGLPSFSRGQKVGGKRFMLMRPLGRGAESVVWLAEDEDRRQSVAAKFLHKSRGDDQFWEAIARTQKLTHPHIVRIHALCEENESLVFIAREHVDGLTLTARRLQETDQFLRWNFLEPLVFQLCDALEYAHAQNIIHGNLKPTNIFLDQAGKVKLADFAMPGSIPHISPQRLNNVPLEARDDVYALGAVLYELLTGKPLFFGSDIGHQVQNLKPTPLEERLGESRSINLVPPHVCALIEWCLVKDASERPQSVKEFADELRELTHDTQINDRQSGNKGGSIFRRLLRRFGG